MTDAPILTTDGLGHTYPRGARPALHGLTLAVGPGEIFGVLGPNGGGKTTLFQILSTRLRPTAGTAAIAGHDVVREAAAVRRHIGVVFQSPSLDDKLTATENLICHAGLYGIARRAARVAAARWLERLDLTDRADDRVAAFSGGMRRRVEIAKALMTGPDLLLMDEPATGLDPGAGRALWDQLHTLRDEAGLTIALTTHLMNEAERCDRLAILDHGRLIACDSPASLRSTIGGDMVTLSLDAMPTDQSPRSLSAVAAELGHRLHLDQRGPGPRVLGNQIQFEHPDGARAVAEVAGAFPGRFSSLSVSRPTLEDVFIQLTGNRFEDPAP